MSRSKNIERIFLHECSGNFKTRSKSHQPSTNGIDLSPSGVADAAGADAATATELPTI